MLKQTLSISLLMVFLAACSDSGTTEPEAGGDERLFDTQRDALEEAQQVEQQLQDAKNRLDSNLEQQTQER